MNTLAQELSQIDAGSSNTFRNLTVFPLFRPQQANGGPGYLLAEEAIARGLARITELADGGSVPELRLENQAEQPVLLLDGEELLGAKQNRVLNLTILAPAKTTTIIPVSCVEAGRWHTKSDTFAPAEHLMFAEARAARVSQVTHSMLSTGSRRSDQGAVWEDIAVKARRMDASSPTQAMNALYERHALTTEEYVRAFACGSTQCGAAFAINGRFVGMDLLDHPHTLGRVFPKLVRSYALDAMEQETNAPAALTASMPAVLENIGRSQTFAQPAVGLGKDVRFSGDWLSGAALWGSGRYVHVCAFASTESDPHPELRTQIARPSRRRRR
jgi:hypothetical protein